MKQLVHMRDQKANLLAMEHRKRQLQREMAFEYYTLLFSIWAISLIVTLN